MSEWALIAVAIGGAVLTFVGTVLTVRVARRNAQTQETQMFMDAAVNLVQPLNERIDELEEELDDLKSELDLERKERKLQVAHNRELMAQLHGVGQEPVSIEEIAFRLHHNGQG